MTSELSRYTTPAMERLWSADTKYGTWAWVETESAAAQRAPEHVVSELRNATVPTEQEVDDEELTTRHDVVAFLNCWRRGMSPEARSWVHRNMTSSDLVDTANALLMSSAALRVEASLRALHTTLTAHAYQHRNTVRIGRTHGQSAEVTTWGWRILEFVEAIDRAICRLQYLESNYAVGKLSGPVGDHKRISNVDEIRAMRALQLNHRATGSQVVMRDGYADFMFALGQAATVIGALALEVRLSARTDTGEVAEGFAAGQRGSSAMPHKKNPITAEKLSGLARLVRAQLEPVWQGIELHHERDISHSSVERIALRTAATLAEYMAVTADQMMRNLVVKSGRMLKNAQNSPELASAAIKDALITEYGVDPEVAWEVVHDAYEMIDSVGYCPLHEALFKAWVSIDSRSDHERPDFEHLADMANHPERLLPKRD